MTMTPRFRAVILLLGFLLVGGAISSSSLGTAEASTCPPCDPVACYEGCFGAGACIYSRIFKCEICTCAP